MIPWYNVFMDIMSNEIAPAGAGETSELMIDWLALSDGLADNHADWLPFLVFGVPYVTIAEIFECDKSNITHALNNHPELSRAVSQGRKMVKRQLHYLWLDQKAVKAWRNIDYYLNLDPFEKKEGSDDYVHDAAMRRTMLVESAKMTKFVLQQLGLHVQRHEVLHNVPTPMFQGDQSLAKLVVERVTMAMEAKSDERDVDVVAAEYTVLTGDEDKKFEIADEEREIEPAYDRRGRVAGYETED
jgi:hypothetical protein